MHFAVPLELKAIDAFATKRKAHFPRSEDIVEVSTSFDTQAKRTDLAMKKVGRKFYSSDGARAIVIMAAQFSVSQLAPYTDWDTLYGEAREHWNALAKIVKRRDLSHVSTRYINRIDIPVDMNERVDLHKYFCAGLSLPPYAQAMALQTFNVNCSLLDPSGLYKYVLQLGSAPSPLIDHMSFTIDIDVATTGILPQSEEKLWDLIYSLRKPKNDLFELVHYTRDEEAIPMTDPQIDVSRMPSQSWTIIAQPFNPRPVSSALTEPPRIPTESPRASDANVVAPSSLEDRLFDNAAELKIALSRIVMHLAPEWRAVIFSQLDTLLDLNNWQDDLAFIQKSTFMTFLRFIIFAAPTRLPSLGVGSTGHILAAWKNGDQHIAVEFLPDDKAAATFVKQSARSKEAVAWRGHVADLKLFIEQYGMIGCIQGNLA